MVKYIKDKSKIDVKFYDSVTDDVLIEIGNRNWTNVGELFVDKIVDSVMHTDSKTLPKKIMVMAIAEYTLVDDQST